MSLIWRSKSGFTLIEALITLVVISVAVLSIAQLVATVEKSIEKERVNTSIAGIRSMIIAASINQSAWDETTRRNPAMACMRTSPASCADGLTATIDLYDTVGTLILSSNDPSFGFDEVGNPCSTYMASGNADCPIQASVTWEVSCSGNESCRFPQELVSAGFKHSPAASRMIVNASKYDLSRVARVMIADRQSPMMVCTTKGMIFIGIDRDAINGDGMATPSDADGCVPHSAFRGQTGESPAGPQGVQGPAGPDGEVVAAATPTPPPPTATPVPTPIPSPSPGVIVPMGPPPSVMPSVYCSRDEYVRVYSCAGGTTRVGTIGEWLPAGCSVQSTTHTSVILPGCSSSCGSGSRFAGYCP